MPLFVNAQEHAFVYMMLSVLLQRPDILLNPCGDHREFTHPDFRRTVYTPDAY